MKHLLLCIGLFASTLAQSAEPLKNPNSVAECVLSLPDSFAGNVPRRARKKGLEKAAAGEKNQILDEKNGYASFGINGKGEYRITAALFPTSNGKPILGINPIYFNLYPEFYQWTGTEWKNVTKEVLPAGVYPKYAFSLPQQGTTVDAQEVVFGEPMDTKEEVAFQLKWTGEKFVRKR